MKTPEIKLRLIAEYAIDADYVLVDESGEEIDPSVEPVWSTGDGFYTGQTLLQYFDPKTRKWEDIDWYRTTEAAVRVKHYIEENNLDFSNLDWRNSVDIYKIYKDLEEVAYGN